MSVLQAADTNCDRELMIEMRLQNVLDGNVAARTIDDVAQKLPFKKLKALNDKVFQDYYYVQDRFRINTE